MNLMVKWLKKWKIKFSESKSGQIKFTLRRNKCPTVKLNDPDILQQSKVKISWNSFVFENKLGGTCVKEEKTDRT